jgi:hypothetical protein
MKLKKKQREALIQWVAEGLESDEINQRASAFKPRFKVLRSQVTYYRNSRDKSLQEIKAQDETSALKTGYALREQRVASLQQLASVIFQELTRDEDNRLWTENAKGIGAGANAERYDYFEFNRSEIEAFRGVLDDIAREVGERRPDVLVNNTYNFNMDEWKKTRQSRLKAIKQLEDAD